MARTEMPPADHSAVPMSVPQYPDNWLWILGSWREIARQFTHSVVKIRRAFVFLNGVTAVDYDELAGDVGGWFRGEKCDSRGDFVGSARATHGSISAGDDFVIWGRGGCNPAGSDRVDCNLLARDLESEATCKSDHGGFGSAIRGFTRIAHDRTGGGGDIDNAPVVRLQHAGQDRLGDIENGFQIDSDTVVPILFRKFSEGQRGGRFGTADLGHDRIVHEDVDTAEASENLLNQRVSAAVVAQIGGESEDIGALCREFVSTVLDSLGRGSDCNLGPLLGEQTPSPPHPLPLGERSGVVPEMNWMRACSDSARLGRRK